MHLKIAADGGLMIEIDIESGGTAADESPTDEHQPRIIFF
jgi:hypothetical protein